MVEDQTFGVLRVGKPKVSHPPAQHVLCESPAVARIFDLVRLAFDGSDGAIFGWSPALLSKKFGTLLQQAGCDIDVPLNITKKVVSMSPLVRRLTVGGLRPGAATQASAQTLRQYLHLGVYYATAIYLPGVTRATLEYHAEFFRCFAANV